MRSLYIVYIYIYKYSRTIPYTLFYSFPVIYQWFSSGYPCFRYTLLLPCFSCLSHRKVVPTNLRVVVLLSATIPWLKAGIVQVIAITARVHVLGLLIVQIIDLLAIRLARLYAPLCQHTARILDVRHPGVCNPQIA